MEANTVEYKTNMEQHHHEVVHYGWKNLIINSAIIFILSGPALWLDSVTFLILV